MNGSLSSSLRRSKRGNRRTTPIRQWILIMGCWLALTGCHREPSGGHVFFDFESDVELDQFHWKCHTLFSLSREHITHGEKSLRLELYPSDYPGLTPMIEKRDWSRYDALRFDIYNPQNEAVTLTVRIDDRKDYPNYADRYNKSFILKPGMNRMRIPLNTLVTSGTNRKLNLQKIYRILVFMTRPEKRVVLYVDYIRLESGGKLMTADG